MSKLDKHISTALLVVLIVGFIVTMVDIVYLHSLPISPMLLGYLEVHGLCICLLLAIRK